MRAIAIGTALVLFSCASGPPPARPLTVPELCEGERKPWTPEFDRATRVNPYYPRDAVAAGVTGWVAMEGIIGSDGQVLEARVVQSEPPGVFDRNALAAFRQWRYCPTTDDGKPRVVDTKLNFALPH